MAEKAVKTGFYSAIGLFFEYDTAKIVHIRSKKVGLINRFIQLVIIAYIIGYAIVYQRGYQEFDDVQSAVTSKMKGVAYTNLSQIPEISSRIWDVADYVVPPQENNAFFVMTNAIITRHQTQDVCQEDPSMADVNCTSNADCPAGTPVSNGNGVRTGLCVHNNRTDIKNVTKVCQIHAWCPVEVDQLPVPGKALLEDSERFTVLIKNYIEFPKFGQKRRNILDAQDSDYLSHCRYDAHDPDDQFCPIFELGAITKAAGIDNYSDISVVGGVIIITIKWECNLDHSIKKCRPEYSFRRLDSKDDKIAKGFNFRYANYFYNASGTEQRDLIKAYGIRFIVSVTGEAGKFSIVPLLMNLGSGLALLAIASVLCDIVTLYVLKKGTFYKEKKYQYVTGDDAFKDFRETIEDADDDDPASAGPSRAEEGVRSRNRAEVDGENPDDGVKNRKVGEYGRLDE